MWVPAVTLPRPEVIGGAFGTAQSKPLKAELLTCCDGIAAGEAVIQRCDELVPGAEGLRFARAGGHYVDFIELEASVIVVDLVYRRMKLGRRIRDLGR